MYLKRNKHLEVLGLYLGNYAKRLYLREISKLAGLPLKTTQTVLGELEKNRIVKSSMHGKNKYFSPNLENIETKLYLMQSEVCKTLAFVKKYPLFKPFLKELKNISAPIIVFGSFAKFTADKNSDVDMLVISGSSVSLPFHILPNKVHEISLSENEFKKGHETGEALIMEIEENHVVFNNHCFLVNSMWERYG